MRRPRWPKSLAWSNEKLMPRARQYIGVVAIRHLAVGMYALVRPEAFLGPSLDAVRRIAPLPIWGVLFLMIGLHAAVVVVSGRELHGRAVLVASSSVTAAWAVGYAFAGLRGQLFAPSLPIVWGALTAKDLVIAGMQLRLPVVELPDLPGGRR